MVGYRLDISRLDNTNFKKLVTAAAKITRGVALPDWENIPEDMAERVFARVWNANEQPLEFVPMRHAITSAYPVLREWLTILFGNLKYYKYSHAIKIKTVEDLDTDARLHLWFDKEAYKHFHIVMCRVPRVVGLHWRTHRSIKLLMETGRKGNKNLEFDFEGLTSDQQEFMQNVVDYIQEGANEVDLPNTQISMLLPQHRMVWCILAGAKEGLLGLDTLIDKRLKSNVQEITKRYTLEFKKLVNNE